MRLGMFDDVSRPRRAPGRWLSYYLLGRRVAETIARRHIRSVGVIVFTYDDGSMAIARDKGLEA